MSEAPELLHLQIIQYGDEKEGQMALLLEGFTTQEQIDFVMEQFKKFMADVAVEVKQ